MPAYLGCLAVIEFTCSYMCFYVGVYLRFGGDLAAGASSIGDLPVRALVFAVLLSLSLLSTGLYRTVQGAVVSETLIRLATAVCIGFLANTTVYYAFPSVLTGRGTLLLALTASLLVIACMRVAFHSTVGFQAFKRNVLILGSGRVAESVQRLFLDLRQPSFRVSGYVTADGDEIKASCVPALEMPDSLLGLARELRADEIVVAMDNRRNNFPARALLDCRLQGIKVTEPLSFIERETGKINLDVLRAGWLIYGRGFRRGALNDSMKRVVDVIVSLVALLILSPTILIAVLAILMESRFRGSVIYRQWRVGRDGRPFQLYKLRSMISDAESDGQARWAQHKDPRITRVGSILRRLSMDELPQIINVLKGEMSLVGPRPERPQFVTALEREIPYYSERHCLRPGLTGWAQLCYPYGASVEDARQKLQYDLYYVKNQSIMFDLLILLQTLDVVIWGRRTPPGSTGEQSEPIQQRAA